MPSEKQPIIICISFLLLGSLSGCPRTGDATAVGASSTARSGDAIANVNVAPSLSLGDKVAEAASKVVSEFLGKFGTKSNITDDVRRQAIDKGVEAGINAAQLESKTPTEQQKEELKTSVTDAVNKATH